MIGRWWQQRRESRVLSDRAIPDALWAEVLQRYPMLAWRSDADRLELRRLATLFLADKEFHGAHGFEVTDTVAACVAAQACVPIIHLGLAAYSSFVGIVIHEDEVVARREIVDDSGVVTFYDEVLSGEAMEGGPVMLSWHDASGAAQAQGEAYNVVIHEFVHVLDQTDGALNGRPSLPDRQTAAHWDRVMEAALWRLCQVLDSGGTSVIDEYGAQGPEEFFPVAAEAFFAQPVGLRFEYPALYDLLAGYFRQDPAAWAESAGDGPGGVLQT